MAASANILMSLSVVGADSAKLQFAAVAAAVVAVGMKLNSLRKDAEEFALKWNNMTLEQREFARAMDKAGNGLVDTGAALKSVAEMGQAGVVVTKELAEAIGKLAAEKGTALGETYDEINQRVVKLTDAIGKGQQRALKAYGIELENTEDLLLAQAEASQKVIDRAEGLEVKITNIDQALAKTENNWDTFTGLLWASVSGSESVMGALEGLNKQLGFFNDMMMDSPEIAKDFIFDLDNLMIGFWSLADAIEGTTHRMDLWSSKLRIASLQAEQSRLIQQAGNVFGVAQPGLPESVFTGAQGVDSAKTKKKKKGGGGGGRSGETMDFSEAEAEFFADFGMEMGAVFRENYLIAGFGRGLAPTQDDMDLLGGDISAGAMQWAAEGGEFEKDAAFWQDKIDVEMEHYWERKWAIQAEADAIEAERRRSELLLDYQAIKASEQMWRSSQQNKLAMTSQFFGYITQLSTVENKKAFAIGKAAAIAQGTINTILAAIKAYQAMAGIPIVGPALGAVAAGVVSAAGMAMVAQIAKQKYGSGGGGVGGFTMPTGGGGGISAGSVGGAWGGSGMGGGTTVIQLNLDGEQIHEAVVNANDKASQQGKSSFTRV